MSVNKAILVGYLGKDPEARNNVSKFSVATNEKWKDKGSGEKFERTEWHKVSAFGRLGEICNQYLKKGSLVFIEGRLQTSSYERDGITRYSTDIIASEMKMLGNRQGESSKPDTGSTSVPDDDIPF